MSRPYFVHTQEISEDMTSPTEKPQTWESVSNRMPTLLCNLESDLPRSQDALGELPEMGIYVFYEKEKPIYVGRTKRMKERISEHGSPSPTKSATFAYLLAKKELEAKGITPEQKSGKPSSRITTADVEKYPCIISAAGKRVSKMQFRVVEVADAIEQAVFEIYAALKLETPYNNFKTS